MNGITAACAMAHMREPNLKIIDDKRFEKALIAGFLAVEPEFKAIGVSEVCNTAARQPCLSFEQYAKRMEKNWPAE